ncbi:hypothetical protein J6590_041104 [Homalodisca vitripennis]|nr:hypothetical protein J6590_041104 [Homalodisca vitripennis]
MRAPPSAVPAISYSRVRLLRYHPPRVNGQLRYLESTNSWVGAARNNVHKLASQTNVRDLTKLDHLPSSTDKSGVVTVSVRGWLIELRCSPDRRRRPLLCSLVLVHSNSNFCKECLPADGASVDMPRQTQAVLLHTFTRAHTVLALTTAA